MPQDYDFLDYGNKEYKGYQYDEYWSVQFGRAIIGFFPEDE